MRCRRGQPTQGAGAVALLVSGAPRLLALAHGITGAYAQDVNDFWRPLSSKQAVVDGHRSVQCYLDALAGACGAWRRLSTASGAGDTLKIAAIVSLLFAHSGGGNMATVASHEYRRVLSDILLQA